MPEKYQVVDSYGNKIGNIAYSTSDIVGYQIEDMKAFSKYGNIGQNGIKNPVDGWVSSVENPAYSESVLKVNSDNQIDDINGYLRNNNTEYKIIENYNQILNGDYDANGKITIVSEREVCPSCDNVVKAFSKDYSNRNYRRKLVHRCRHRCALCGKFNRRQGCSNGIHDGNRNVVIRL